MSKVGRPRVPVTDPLLSLWAAVHKPPGQGPLLEVRDRYGDLFAYRRAAPGVPTVAGVVTRAAGDIFFTERADETEVMHIAKSRRPLPVIQLV